MLWCLYLVSFCAERPSTQLGKAFSGRRRILPPVVVVLRLASRRTSSSKRSRFKNLTGAYIPAVQGKVYALTANENRICNYDTVT